MNKFVKLGLSIASMVVPGVAQIEATAKAIGGLKGKDKQDAVVDLVTNAIKSAEFVVDKDFVNDEDVVAATRALIDAEVSVMNAKAALEKVIAAKKSDTVADAPSA